MARLVRLFRRSRPAAAEPPPLNRWDVAMVVFQILSILLGLAGALVGVVENLR
jgi:hypothetical protein